MPVRCVAYAAHSAESPLSPLQYEIHDPEDHEVLVEVYYCGVCHSDVEVARDVWGTTQYPVVLGPECTGVIAKTGSQVTLHKIGDKVAVGEIYGSCGRCDNCLEGLESYCPNAVTAYGSPLPDGKCTTGAYGSYIVLPEKFVFKLPDALPMDRAAPLLCAGITVYSPLLHNKMNQGGKKVGVVGLGGLGHMAVQFAAAFGNEVTVFVRTKGKEEFATKLGAARTVDTTDAEKLAACNQTLDLIIDTVAGNHDLSSLLPTLKRDGIIVLVGGSTNIKLLQMYLIHRRLSIQGSLVGSIKETQDMLQFCAQKNVLPLIELIRADQINEAHDRILKSDVRFRFVVDVKDTNAPLNDTP